MPEESGSCYGAQLLEKPKKMSFYQILFKLLQNDPSPLPPQSDIGLVTVNDHCPPNLTK